MKKQYIMIFAVMLATGLFLSVMPAVSSAAGFKVYPGAKLDERAMRDSDEMAKQMKMSVKSKIYTTNDSFEKVAAFYKGIAREYIMPGNTQKGIKARFFIFDNGKDLSDSKLWAKVQRPALSLYKEDIKTMKTRDITVIILVEK
ncbi:MAG: hypothetical protein V1874_02800 [Spirochaetota bacterium]